MHVLPAGGMCSLQLCIGDGGSGKSWGGQYREYVMDLLNKPSITIEIGSSVAPCPYWQYEIEFQKNRYVVVRIANALK